MDRLRQKGAGQLESRTQLPHFMCPSAGHHVPPAPPPCLLRAFTRAQELPSAYHASHALPATWQGKDGNSAVVNAEHCGVMYSCHSCLHPLFHAGNIVIKVMGDGGSHKGAAFFTEPLKWMRAQRIHRSTASFISWEPCPSVYLPRE
jgi:hypothetical protein